MTYIPKTSDAAVKKATGKTWQQWFALLDKTGAKKLPHKEIARLLYHRHFGGAPRGGRSFAPDVAQRSGWWSQMITVEYERARGLRAVNQTSTGFNVSVHGTFPVPLSRLFSAWRQIAGKEKLVEATVRPNKVIRYRRAEGKPLYNAMFASKGPHASRIGIEAWRLQRAADVEKQRRKWKSVLKKLERQLEHRLTAPTS